MKKIPVWKNVVLIISVLVVTIIATLAWFVTGPRGSVDDVYVNVGEASFVQISPDNGGTWSEDLIIDIGINKNFKEISGDGRNFFAPVYDVIENSEGGFSPAIVAFEKISDNGCYYEQIFAFRSDADYEIYLDPASYVTSVSDQEDSYIEGAIRVAFFELDENNKETLKCIWAPNSTIEFSEDTYSFTKEGSVEANYYYQKSATPVDVSTLTDDSTNPHMVKIPTVDPESPEERSDCGYNEMYKFMWSSGENLPENAPSLLTFDLAEGESLASKQMKIVVWLEGHDRECVSLLSGQQFTMSFQFNADKGE